MKTLDASLAGEIAQRFGTPVYVYDGDVVRDRVATLQRFHVGFGIDQR